MRSDRNFNPEWGYVAPAPSVMRTARLIVVAAIIGATAGAAAVFSLLDRRVGEESVAARTLVVPDPMRPVATSRSVADQQRPEPQQAKSPPRAENSAEQKVRPAPAGAAARPLPSDLATTSTPQSSTSAAALAEAPAVKETLNDTIAVEAPPQSAPKPQSTKPRVTSRTAPRYDAWGYDRYFDRPRYGYEPRSGYEPRYGSRGSSAWAPYY